MGEAGHLRRVSAAVGIGALAAYAALKASWAVGVDVGVRDGARWRQMLASLSEGELFAALWGTVGLDLLAIVLLLVLASARAGGSSLLARLLRTAGWLAGTALLLLGSVALAVTLGPVIGLWPTAPGDPGPLAEWVFLLVYGSFTVAGACYLPTTASQRIRTTAPGPRPAGARHASPRVPAPIAPGPDSHS
ncbi:hypothetical protein [Kineococcus glutinatus]|uniref:Uncharacterized protein n=1 Tax=Kineococcus glutinatus TaxID=1070872 RepID=A0ABP9H707_9ACTN